MEFFVTSLIVVLLPGTGVLYTVSIGLTRGRVASVAAAIGCTAGILPHLLASILGLAAILHASSLAFQTLKYLGVLYLAYLAWGMWRDAGEISLRGRATAERPLKIGVTAFLINILNPKLSIFFLAFLPQFVPGGEAAPGLYMTLLGGLFMLMTLIVFLCYGLFADAVRHHIVNSPGVVAGVQRSFAALFVALGVKLATMER
ncbi:MAG: LysE family translocator [Gammaproteobacteria bacterium]|nr:LysE family translocator [Gammaproteobacteria bacterium]